MTQADNPFDRSLARWKAEQATPWGQLKYRLVAANLDRHLPSGPLRILDAGGGDGAESLALARAGHHVTLVDASAAMLAEAQQAVDAGGLQAQVTIIRHDLAGLATLFPDPAFNLVLCHNVLQYIPAVGRLLDDLLTVLQPGGVLSLLSVNRYSLPYQAAFLHHDLERAYAALDATTQQTAVFGAPMTLSVAEEIHKLLSARGLTRIHHYGVRCICDYWGDNTEKAQPEVMAQIERLEQRLATMEPYKHLARYYQLIAVKG